MAKNDKGTTHQLTSQSRRRPPRFFLCGICNIVSIAENTPSQENTSENNVHAAGKEKRFATVREAQNKDQSTLERNTSESELNLSSKDEQSAELQEPNRIQSLTQKKAVLDGERMKKIESSRKKICWNAGEELENFERDIDAEKHTVDSSTDQVSSRTLQNGSDQGDFSCTEIDSPELHQDEECENETRSQPDNSVPKDPKFFVRKHFLESVETTESELMAFAPVAKQASNVPEIKINGNTVKPTWSEEEPVSPGSRWKRVIALKANANRGKRRQRDSATINEEYDMMMENLKQYGVL